MEGINVKTVTDLVLLDLCSAQEVATRELVEVVAGVQGRVHVLKYTLG